MDKHQHLLCKYGQIQPGPRGVRARPTSRGHSASPGAGAALHMETGARPTDCSAPRGRGGGRGGPGVGGTGGQQGAGVPPAWETPSGSRSASPCFSSPSLFPWSHLHCVPGPVWTPGRLPLRWGPACNSAAPPCLPGRADECPRFGAGAASRGLTRFCPGDPGRRLGPQTRAGARGAARSPPAPARALRGRGRPAG